MLKNKIILLPLIVIVCGSCVKKSKTPLFSQWMSLKKEKLQPSVVERRLASSSQEKTLRDLFKEETLKEEMEELEALYTEVPKVQGTWRHLDLSTLSVPQGLFLKEFGKKIGDLKDKDSIDYSSCIDVPCIFNKIYGKDKGVAGYVHYLWFLKFGHLLSADNSIPTITGKDDLVSLYQKKPKILSDYLYNENELFAFWKLSLMLKSPLNKLKYLKEIQKIPRGEKFETHADACGLAYSYGFILLQDDCLRLDESSESGYFYHAVTHEMVHHLDFELGRGTRDFYRSHKKDYLEVSGLFIDEFVNDKGEKIRYWKLKKDAKAVTSYATTMPQENFAETLALYRIEGDLTKNKISDEHYFHVSETYYQSKKFESEALMNDWISQSSVELSKDVAQIVIDCKQSQVSATSRYFSLKDLTARVLPTKIHCYSERAEELARELRAHLIKYEPQGHHVISLHKEKWDQLIKSEIIKIFDRHLLALENDPNYLSDVLAFYQHLSDKSYAYESYIECYERINHDECFSQEVKKRFMSRASDLNLKEKDALELSEQYLGVMSFSSTEQEIHTAIKAIVLNHRLLIIKEADDLWKTCQNDKHDDVNPPSGMHFVLSDGYLVSSFYNCLNLGIPERFKIILRSVSVDNQKIQLAQEESLYLQEIKPIFITHLQKIYEKEKIKESQWFENWVTQESDSILTELKSNFSWIKSGLKKENVKKDCLNVYLSKMKKTVLFHSIKDLFSSVENKLCSTLTDTDEFKKHMESSGEQNVSLILNEVSLKVYALATKQAQVCLIKYPITNILNRVRFWTARKSCLLNEWSKIEDQVMTEIMQSEMFPELILKRSDLEIELSIHRKALQRRVMIDEYDQSFL